MTKGIETILSKTEHFIKAFYRNKMLKGSIIAFSLLLLLFLLIDIVEYFSWLNTDVRTFLFYSFILVTGAIVVYYIVIPFLKLLHIGKTLNHEQAAKIIGQHIKAVDDKLLNSIELLNSVEQNSSDTDLLLASLDQKAKELTPIPFVKAIDKKASYKKLRFLIPILTVLLLLFFISPSLIVGPSKRIVYHNVFFQKPLPFQFHLLTDSLVCLQNEDFTVTVRFTGNNLPEHVYLTRNGNSYLMEQNRLGNFQYAFKTVSSDIYFRIITNHFKTIQYHLRVFPKPVILNYNVQLLYPKYLGKKDEELENTDEMVVPEGTITDWKIYTKDVDTIYVLQNQLKSVDTLRADGNVFGFTKRISVSFSASLLARNIYTMATDSLFIRIKSIKDEFPTITVKEMKGMKNLKSIFFDGQISDDYGFHALQFYYKKSNSNQWKHYNLDIERNTTELNFQYAIKTADFGLRSGEQLDYYFSVSDNDAIHHFKVAKTAEGHLEMPNEEQLKSAIDSTSKQFKNRLEETLKKLNSLNKKIEENKLNILNKKKLNWADKERLKNLLQEELDIQEKLKEMEDLRKQQKELEKMKDTSVTRDLSEKMKSLEKMFSALKDPQLLAKIKEAKKNLDKMDRDKLNKMLDQLKEKNSNLEKNLDTNEELYKQLEFEKKFSEILKNLDSLQLKQKREAFKNNNRSVDKKTALKNQNKLNEGFKKIKKNIDDALKLNKNLEDPMNIKPNGKLEDSISEEMQNASEKLSRKHQKKASKSQQSAGKKLKKLKNQLQLAFQNEMSSRMGEDAENMKRLLDNLVQLSFDQEQNIYHVENTSKNDPNYIRNVNHLQQIRQNFGVIKDSLFALSKRNIFVKPFINRETRSVVNSLDRAASAMQERQTSQTLTNQQYAMTSLNNLALLLEESLERMQQSMMNMQKSGKGKQSCPHPGSGQGQSLSNMMQKQQKLSKSLNKMKGKNKGKQKGGTSGENGSSEQLAKMAELQLQIRLMLQQYMDQLKANGGNGNAMNEIMKEMLNNEKDIVNNNITEKTLRRQNDIKVRLLEAENARLERNKKKERESKEGKNIKRSNLTLEKKYKNQKKSNRDVLITKPVRLNPFYRSLHNKYLNKLKKDGSSH